MARHVALSLKPIAPEKHENPWAVTSVEIIQQKDLTNCSARRSKRQSLHCHCLPCSEVRVVPPKKEWVAELRVTRSSWVIWVSLYKGKMPIGLSVPSALGDSFFSSAEYDGSWIFTFTTPGPILLIDLSPPLPASRGREACRPTLMDPILPSPRYLEAIQ